LTKDPEIRYTQAAEPVCVAKYTLAVNRRFKKEGEPDADFINCVSFRKTAEFAERYLKRGMQIAVWGSLQVRSFDDNAGQRRWVTEVIAEEAQFTESKAAFDARMAQRGGGGGGFEEAAGPAHTPPSFEPEGFAAITQSIDDDDLPF
jgi:single-strand DNA-binding protein